jgi:iron complex outermembrane receptor protein
MRPLRIFQICLLKGLLLSYALPAQELDTVNFYRLTIEDLSQTTVSAASKIAQRKSEAPGVVSVFSQEELQRFGWFSAQQVLERLPGFSPSQDYDRRTVSARGVFEGWNNNHLLVLVDGVQFNDNLYGTAYTWELTPLMMAKSVEVVRGPASALYGTNAVNGLVSLTTLSPGDLKGNGMAQARMGSNGLQLYDLVLGGRSRAADVLVSFNAFETDGNAYDTFDDSFRADSLGNPLQFRTQDKRSSQYFFGKIQGKGALSGFSLQVHEQHWQFETGHGWLFNIPDQPESMRESRRVAALRYQTPQRGHTFQQEYTLRYQRHGLDWNMRYYPDGAFDNFYPDGVSEYLRTDASDWLLRGQWTYRLRGGSALLGGVEHNIFLYGGDEAHTSNIDLVSTFEPFPGNDFRDMPPWFEFVEDLPVRNTGIFAQYLSPKMAGERLQATLSLRYDLQAFDYTDIYDPERPLRAKSFSQLSPRIGLVASLHERFTAKLLAGRAFRTPSPTEMFGANTYSLASNIDQLRPEIITTFEVHAEWQAKSWLQLMATAFYNDFEGIIAYSVANANLSTNLYDLSSAGAELEAGWALGAWSGFANYTYTRRIGERIVDETIAESEELTWFPAHAAAWGLQYRVPDYYATLSGRWQGSVARRATGLTGDSRQFRPDAVAGWAMLDAKFAVTALPQLEFGLLVTNLLDAEAYLVKNNAYRFDYRMPRRQWMANVLVRF